MRFVMMLALSVVAISCENATSGQTGPGAGGGGRGGGGGGGPTVATDTQTVQGGRAGQIVAPDTTPVQRISVQREVDLSGTLLSPDQARVSSEVAGIIRDVPVQLGTEVRAGELL